MTTHPKTGITVSLTPDEAALLEARAVRLGCVDAIEYLTGLARMNVHLEAARGAQGA